MEFLTQDKMQIMMMAMAGVIVFLLIMVFYLLSKISGINKKYGILMQGSENTSLEDMFIKRLDKINDTSKNLDALHQDVQKIRKQMVGCNQKLSVVRFNAFENMGSDLSYAVAVLDENNDGVVFSSLFTRNESRNYAKPITAGTSTYTLTDEEVQAIKEAQQKFKRVNEK